MNSLYQYPQNQSDYQDFMTPSVSQRNSLIKDFAPLHRKQSSLNGSRNGSNTQLGRVGDTIMQSGNSLPKIQQQNIGLIDRGNPHRRKQFSPTRQNLYHPDSVTSLLSIDAENDDRSREQLRRPYIPNEADEKATPKDIFGNIIKDFSGMYHINDRTQLTYQKQQQSIENARLYIQNKQQRLENEEKYKLEQNMKEDQQQKDKELQKQYQRDQKLIQEQQQPKIEVHSRNFDSRSPIQERPLMQVQMPIPQVSRKKSQSLIDYEVEQELKVGDATESVNTKRNSEFPTLPDTQSYEQSPYISPSLTPRVQRQKTLFKIIPKGQKRQELPQIRQNVYSGQLNFEAKFQKPLVKKTNSTSLNPHPAGRINSLQYINFPNQEQSQIKTNKKILNSRFEFITSHQLPTYNFEESKHAQPLSQLSRQSVPRRQSSTEMSQYQIENQQHRAMRNQVVPRVN